MTIRIRLAQTCSEVDAVQLQRYNIFVRRMGHASA